MTTIEINVFTREGSFLHEFPHTGAVYYGTGARPYGAALKGIIMTDSRNRVLEFKTAVAAERAVLKATK